MEELYQQYKDKGVTHLFVYVREAHPGENYPQPDTVEQKLAHARAFQREEKIRRTIVVDTIDGDVHQAYGDLSDSAFVVDKRGILVYKAAWTRGEDIRHFVEMLVRADEARGQGQSLQRTYVEKLISWPMDIDRSRRGLRRAGQKAVEDVLREFPNSALFKDSSRTPS